MSQPPEDSTLRRYVVLHHWGVDEPHFDFLFETKDNAPLMTFRLTEWPLSKDQAVTRLKDHRRLYLTYEGEIPDGRGRVDRVAEGQIRVTGTASGWLLETPGGEFFALFEPQDPPYAGDQAEWWVTTPAR